MISHVFGLVGEYISLLLTNQHLEEEPPIVETKIYHRPRCVDDKVRIAYQATYSPEWGLA